MQAPLTKNWDPESKNQDCLGFPFMDRDQWRILGRSPDGSAPRIFLDQTEVRRAEKKNLRPPPPVPPPVSQGLDDRAPPSLKICIRLQ